MNQQTTIPLTQVPRELMKVVRERDKALVPTYKRIYTAVVNAHVPAEQDPNGRYKISADNMSHIMRHFGLQKKDR